MATSWQAMQHKAPSLLTGTTIANVETANVKGITYYRLKLGAYQYQKNAQADCDKLKQQQVSCIVSYYTDNPVKL
ncbi:SPOR domain-containing protein [Pseudoalteromonas mariniglutinosa]